jgi:hypothetical protein
MADNVVIVTRQLVKMADNSQDKTANTPDNALKNDDSTLDSAPECESIAADDIQQNAAKAENFDKISISELLKKYGIGRDPLYARMRYLAITTWKVSGKAYLDAGQIAQMDGLHDHIKATGRMEGYPIPEPTGPKPEGEGQKLQAAQGESTVEDNVEKSFSLVVSENGAFETQAETTTLQTQTINTTISNADIEQIKLEAQQRVKTKRMAVIQVARAYEENPEKLPLEIQQEIEQAEMAAISTPISQRSYYDPNVLAQLVIQTL